MAWLQIAIECESCSLNDLSKELYSCRYAVAGQVPAVVSAVIKGLRRGMSTAALVGILGAAGFTGAFWGDIVDTIKQKIDNREVIQIEKIVSDIQSGLKVSLEEETLPDRQLDVPVGAPVPQEGDVNSGAIADYVAAHEGSRDRVYRDTNGYQTIGVGHLLTDDSRRIFQELFGNAVDFDRILSGQATLSGEQISTLFEYDLQSRIASVGRIFPRFNTYPQAVQSAIVDGIYRGDLGPRTRNFIRAGEWAAAAVEYLDHREYQAARASLDRGVRPHNAGIVTRMEQNRDAFRDYANAR